ncbi:MAG: bifunctional riboflavin kinase/FAD synthetase [Proteobacteria bacterium]|nr:bifunctional riboflavin kinase/FAD synthetase [Pseudomonadota bacterium]
MIHLRDLSDLPNEIRGGAVSIGNFDGVHRGHARIVERLIARAREVQGPAVVFTFDPHPVSVLRPEKSPPPLTWIQRKIDLLDELGVDVVVTYPTDRALLELTPQDFFCRIVREQLAAKAIVEGPNFYFGKSREGDVEMLESLCQKEGILLDIVEPLQENDAFISSSFIRRMIVQGELQQAAKWLTRPYRIRGKVVQGAQRGREIGFPTANLEQIDTLLPGPGVYAGRAYTDKKCWPAAINIGTNPTFNEETLKIEVHLVGFDGSLYGCPLEVDILARLREIQPFSSVEELQRQLALDVKSAKDWFSFEG